VAQFSQALTNNGIISILQPAGLSVFLDADVTISVAAVDGSPGEFLLAITPNPDAESVSEDGLSRTTIIIIIVCVIIGIFVSRFLCLAFCVTKKSSVGEFTSIGLGEKANLPTKFGGMNKALATVHNGGVGGTPVYTNISHTGGTPMVGTPPTPSSSDGVWQEWMAEQKGPNSLNFSLKKSDKKMSGRKGTSKLGSGSSQCTPAAFVADSGGRSSSAGIGSVNAGFMSGGTLVTVGSRVLRSFGAVDYPGAMTMVDHSMGCCEMLYDDGNVETGVPMAEVRPDGPQSPPQQVQQPSFTPTLVERMEHTAEGLVHSITHAAEGVIHHSYSNDGQTEGTEGVGHTPDGSLQYQQQQRQPVSFDHLRSSMGAKSIVENYGGGKDGDGSAKKRFEL
jgi:hypothetical protein